MVKTKYSQTISRWIVKNQRFLYWLSSFPVLNKKLEQIFTDLTFEALKKLRKCSAGERKILQLKRLHKLIKYADAKIPFWRDRFNKAGINPANPLSFKDFEKFPILKREELREALVADESRCFDSSMPKHRVVETLTTGSSGVPLKVFHDYKYLSITAGANKLMELHFNGIDLNGKVIVLNAPSLLHEPPYFQEVLVFGKEKFFEQKEMIYRKINELGCRVLKATTSAALLLAELAKTDGVLFNLDAVVTLGEAMSEADKNTLESIFRCPICHVWGSTEAQTMGLQCKVGRGFHVADDYNLLEVVDGSGYPVERGELGNIVVTNLNKYIMPFIRYDTGDVGRFIDETCPCGDPRPRIQLEGRNKWYFLLPNGEKVRHFFIRGLLRLNSDFYLKVKDHQFIQESPHLIRLYVVPQSDWIDSDSLKLETFLRNSGLGSDIKIEILAVPQIGYSTRKRLPFVSKIND